MKKVSYTRSATRDLKTYKAEASRIMEKIERYAETGLGDVVPLKGGTGCRLRVGDFRALFLEDNDELIVTKIGPRGSIYE